MNYALRARQREPVFSRRLFPTFFAGGFECGVIRRRSGSVLDIVAASRHDRFAHLDYLRLQQLGIGVAREGVRWHLAEATPAHYDFSTVLPIVRASRSAGTQVIWDLCHFSWPTHLDIFAPDFITSLARFGAAFARWLSNEVNGPLYFVPINEMSFFSWAAADEGSMYPFALGRGGELKRQLVRAAIEAMESIWHVVPSARFLHVEPIIHVLAHPKHPEQQQEAEAYRLAQYEAFDMLTGRVAPELGGNPKYLDLVGVNFYRHNQWFYNLNAGRRVRRFMSVSRRHPLYRPFREMLSEVYLRFQRPVFIAETGAEAGLRRSWLRYVCEETQAALKLGVPVQGICLYPILNHPGWEDDRHCHNGLWDYSDEHGQRPIHRPLAMELRRWQAAFDTPNHSRPPKPPIDGIPNDLPA